MNEWKKITSSNFIIIINEYLISFPFFIEGYVLYYRNKIAIGQQSNTWKNQKRKERKEKKDQHLVNTRFNISFLLYILFKQITNPMERDKRDVFFCCVQYSLRREIQGAICINFIIHLCSSIRKGPSSFFFSSD